jgi:hypothetical protein
MRSFASSVEIIFKEIMKAVHEYNLFDFSLTLFQRHGLPKSNRPSFQITK